MLEKYISFIKDCLFSWEDRQSDFSKIYSSFGILEEVEEFESTLKESKNNIRVKAKLEAGDVCWYVCAYLVVFGETDESISNIFNVKSKRCQSPVSVAISINKAINKNVFYGKFVGTDMEKLATIVAHIKFMCEDVMGIQFDDVLEANMRKIDQRYPSGRQTKHIVKDHDEEIQREIENGKN